MPSKQSLVKRKRLTMRPRQLQLWQGAPAPLRSAGPSALRPGCCRQGHIKEEKVSVREKLLGKGVSSVFFLIMTQMSQTLDLSHSNDEVS